jgi:hypothetical protein
MCVCLDTGNPPGSEPTFGEKQLLMVPPTKAQKCKYIAWSSQLREDEPSGIKGDYHH